VLQGPAVTGTVASAVLNKPEITIGTRRDARRRLHLAALALIGTATGGSAELGCSGEGGGTG
jgi:hypothetical protein